MISSIAIVRCGCADGKTRRSGGGKKDVGRIEEVGCRLSAEVLKHCKRSSSVSRLMVEVIISGLWNMMGESPRSRIRSHVFSSNCNHTPLLLPVASPD